MTRGASAAPWGAQKGHAIDLNADLGESFGVYRMPGDVDLLPAITSANIACGFHAGDPRVLDDTVSRARSHGVAVGAQPGFADLVGFGRRRIEATSEEIVTDVLYQIGALSAFCRRHGIVLQHVKAHGALGNMAWSEEPVAKAVVDAVVAFDPDLILVALSGSVLERVAQKSGLRVAREAFLDRAYTPDGGLVPRDHPGAVLHDRDEIVSRARQMALEGTVRAADGSVLEVAPDTLCVHGDTSGALAIASAVRTQLPESGVRFAPLSAILAARGA